jgi:secernin
LGCDTFVALPPATPRGTVLFGKNSDRPCGEGQSIRRYPGTSHGEGTIVQCTYKSIQQVPKTFAVLLSQLDWCYGAEMGANECGVVIGNEAVWTKIDEEKDQEPSLLGMDLVRLGLERASTAKEALHCLTQLLETHGQGGACAENDPSFTYDNSFLIADAGEAWILETAGRHWVAKRVMEGTCNISNGLVIRCDYDLHSEGLHAYARQQGFWDGGGRLDWAATFAEGGQSDLQSPRQERGCWLLQERPSSSTGPWMYPERMMDILRDHKGGICMHGPGFETTASMVSELCTDRKSRHWMTGQSLPCQSQFHLQHIGDTGK